MRVGIEAFNLKAGGGITHLVQLLQVADPERDRFERVTVWGPRDTLDRLPQRAWLRAEEPPELRGGFVSRLQWLRSGVSARAGRDCDIVFAPGGTYLGTVRPVVTMSRNMIPFDPVALRRFGLSTVRARLEILRVLQARTFRSVDGLIFLTETAKRAVTAATGPIAGATTVIPHGIATDFFAEPRVQRPLGTVRESEPLRLLYVSIIDVYKHQAEVAEAVAVLRREGIPLTLELIGPAYPPELRRLEAVRQRVDPAREFIRYEGPRSYGNLPALYRSTEIFIFASSCENLPNVLLEGMASGLPIACSDKSVMPEVLGDAGVYFDPTDPQSIATSLRRLIGDSTLRASLAAAAHARATRFSWQRCAAATFAFLREVLDRHHSPRQ